MESGHGLSTWRITSRRSSFSGVDEEDGVEENGRQVRKNNDTYEQCRVKAGYKTVLML